MEVLFCDARYHTTLHTCIVLWCKASHHPSWMYCLWCKVSHHPSWMYFLWCKVSQFYLSVTQKIASQLALIITTQDKDSTRKNSSGLLHAMIKVKIQKIALLAVVGWHHQCPNSLFHNSSRIHKCQQWQGMTRVPPPKVPKWLRLTRMQKGQDMSKQSTNNSAVQTHWNCSAVFGLPCYARKAWPHAPPANALAHRFAVIRHSKTLLATLAPRVWVLRRPRRQGMIVTKTPTEHSLRVRPTPGQRCENEQHKLFTWIRRKLPRRAADVQGLAPTRKPSDCSSLGRAKHNICGQDME